MRLARKFTLVLVLVATGILVAMGVLSARRAIALYEAQIESTQRTLASVLSQAVVTVWENQGWQEALAFLQRVEHEHQGEIRWVWFEYQGLPEYRPRVSAAALNAALRTTPQPSFRVDRDGVTVAVLYQQVPLRGLPPGGLEISRSLAAVEQHVAGMAWVEAGTTLSVILIYALLASVLGRWFVAAPIGQLIAQAQRIGRGEFSMPSAIPQRDEIGELGREMNIMAYKLATARAQMLAERQARLETEGHLRHADRLITVGALSASLIHDLGTPLNVICVRAGMIRGYDVPRAEVIETAGIIERQARRMTDMIRRVLTFARRGGGSKREPVSVAALLRETVALLEGIADKSSVRLEADPTPEDIALLGDAGELRQMLNNLVMNAIQAMPWGGVVRLSAVRRANNGDQAPWVEIAVVDEGQGIAPEHLPHIFDPFFTTKGAGVGTGLGLWATQSIVREHGGEVQVQSEPGVGCRFALRLPALTNGGSSAEAPP